MKNKIQKNIKAIVGIVLVLSAVFYFAKSGSFGKNNYEIINSKQVAATVVPAPSAVVKNDEVKKENTDELSDEAVTPYGQESCQNSTRRSIAVMMPTDAIARPLSGISQADIVFEMPVIQDGITRLMAVFGCTIPMEIGSIRSARHDYIDLANSVDAIYVHWGGSHYALDRLKTGVIDEIDALVNPYGVFYRKSGIPAPHNGFANGETILDVAAKLKFRLENKFKGFPREKSQIPNPNDQPNPKSQILNGILKIGFPGEFRVEYQYDAAANVYLRWRGEKKEIDKNNKKQVTTKNVIAMFAESKQIEKDYNDVALAGQEGKAEFYINGGKIDGIWKMDGVDKTVSLHFYNVSGEEIKFVAGNIWVEILQTNQKTEWSGK